jgi:hypothetical protein
MVIPSLHTIGRPHFFWISTHFDLGPNVMRTASARAVAPLRTFSRAADLNKSRLPAIVVSFLMISGNLSMSRLNLSPL